MLCHEFAPEPDVPTQPQENHCSCFVHCRCRLVSISVDLCLHMSALCGEPLEFPDAVSTTVVQVPRGWSTSPTVSRPGLPRCSDGGLSSAWAPCASVPVPMLLPTAAGPLFADDLAAATPIGAGAGDAGLGASGGAHFELDEASLHVRAASSEDQELDHSVDQALAYASAAGYAQSRSSPVICWPALAAEHVLTTSLSGQTSSLRAGVSSSSIMPSTSSASTHRTPGS